MKEQSIRSLSLTRNCMQSEGELRFCISLYEIFFNLDFNNLGIQILAIQLRSTIHERISGMKSEKLICMKFYFIVRKKANKECSTCEALNSGNGPYHLVAQAMSCSTIPILPAHTGFTL